MNLFNILAMYVQFSNNSKCMLRVNLSIRLVVLTALVASTTQYTANINKEQLSLTNMKQLKHLLAIQ